LKEEAKEVKIRDKSQRRESRHARRAASTGRGAAMKVYDDSAKNSSRREESKSPPRRKKTPAPVKKEVKKEVKVEQPAQVVEIAAKSKSPEPVQKLMEDEKVKAVGYVLTKKITTKKRTTSGWKKRILSLKSNQKRFDLNSLNEPLSLSLSNNRKMHQIKTLS
jgi:hypothetical protein